jgi:hypothetical protein
MRLTTRKTDAFSPLEEEMFILIASEGTAWFLPAISHDKSTALQTLERLGHIYRTWNNRPRDVPNGSKGFRVSDHGKQALAELTRRKAS